ncbi:MAG: hypothetical protein FWG82_05725, partial [Oscillospiraceae bacterium]|nr:hypothetical protein [Oscillospiraceae bacterium]
MKHSTKILSIILSLATFVQVFVFGINAEQSEVVTANDEVSLRGEFEKHFLNEDGTYTAVSYADAVHYDNQGEWSEIDNTLVKSKEGGETVYKTADNPVEIEFAQKADSDSLFSIANDGHELSWSLKMIAEETAPEEETEAVTEGDAADVSEAVPEEDAVVDDEEDVPEEEALVDEESVTQEEPAAEIEDSEEPADEPEAPQGQEEIIVEELKEYTRSRRGNSKGGNSQRVRSLNKRSSGKPEKASYKGYSKSEERMLAKKSGSAIVYEEVLPSIDVKYSVASQSVKEEIILDKPTDIEAFAYIITTDLSGAIDEYNYISFTNEEGREIFSLSPADMSDAAMAHSYDIVEILTEVEGGYLLTLIPDAEWLNSPDRVYPIVIDPTVSANTESANMSDTYVKDGSGAMNIYS